VGAHEEYVFNDRGEMLNASFLDYRMPTSLDLPMIDAVIVEVPNPGIRMACGASARCQSCHPWRQLPTHLSCHRHAHAPPAMSPGKSWKPVEAATGELIPWRPYISRNRFNPKPWGKEVTIEATTVRQIIARLEASIPGWRP